MRIEDVIVDEEFETFLPALQPEERANLKEEIERDGFTDPIIVWMNHGQIVDGYNRYRIWQELGSDPDKCPDIVERKFDDRAAVMEWMFRHQLSRRNLTPAQRAEVALKLKPAIAERATAAKADAGKSAGVGGKKVLTNSSKPISRVNTRKEVAKIAGVSEDTVRKTEVVLKEGTPEIKAAMSSGEMSANQAFQQTRKISGGTKFDPDELEDGEERQKPPKNGTVAGKYNEKKIDTPLGVIRRELDSRLACCPGTDRQYRAAKHALGEFQNKMEDWRAGK